MSTRDVQIKDIPIAVLDQVEKGLRHYFVPILAFWAERPVPELKLIGSGTLIDIAGKGYILTAGHVWAATAGADSLHLLMMSGRSRVEIPCIDISASTIWDRAASSEWGPDLALLEIPAPQLGSIRACKSFLNYGLQSDNFYQHPSKYEKTLWAVYGVVDEFSDVTVNQQERSLNAELVGRAFFGRVTETHDREGFDYYDTGANLQLPGVPSSFGGVSGGGLWQVGLEISKSGEYSWNGRRGFRGVAFWQSSNSDGQRIVRCHGPRSIFGRDLDQLG